MVKYIDADLLKKKIGRMKGYISVTHFAEELLSFIASLQKEQPEVNVEKVCGTCTYWQEGTLDRGICQAEEPHQTHSAETCERWEGKEQPIGIHDIGVEGENGVNASDLPECQNVFKVLSKPMQVIRKCEETEKSALKKSEEVDLEAEIGKVFFSRRFEDEHGRFSIQLSLEEFSDIAKHFAEWQKQQMLKDAVEGYITLTLTGQPTIAALLNDKEFTPNDKLKIVVIPIKEDKQ